MRVSLCRLPLMDEPCWLVVMKSGGGQAASVSKVWTWRFMAWRYAVGAGGTAGLLGVMFLLLASGGEGHAWLRGWPPGCESQELCYQIRLEWGLLRYLNLHRRAAGAWGSKRFQTQAYTLSDSLYSPCSVSMDVTWETFHGSTCLRWGSSFCNNPSVVCVRCNLGGFCLSSKMWYHNLEEMMRVHCGRHLWH